MKSYNNTNYCHFTLIELIVSMAVFTLLMFVLISFFDVVQKSWSTASAKSETFANARIALDLIERDIQSIYYDYGRVPFWHRQADNSNSEMIAFTATVDELPNSYCQSRICEVRYKLGYTGSEEGWLYRSVTGDKDSSNQTNDKWNFNNNFNVADTGNTNAFTLNDDSGESFKKVIPHVTRLTFFCFQKKIVGSSNLIAADTTGNTPTRFPYSIRVEISIMDKKSWEKWKTLHKTDPPSPPQKFPYYIYNYDTSHTPPVLTLTLVDSDTQRDFRIQHERTFSRTIFIGERGQKGEGY